MTPHEDKDDGYDDGDEDGDDDDDDDHDECKCGSNVRVGANMFKPKEHYKSNGFKILG